MSERHIPPLKSDLQSTHLLQVNAIIRHGARTPFTSELHCWDDDALRTTNTTTPSNDDDDDDDEWDCRLTTLMSPPKPQDGAMFLFEKKYDALRPPQGNLLGGSCELGQLLHDGYDQELFNGNVLRRAYLESDNNLFLYKGLPEDLVPYDPSLLYFRGDDQQRTLMSGQVLIRGLFGEEIREKSNEGDVLISVHTSDKTMDVLVPNAKICPRLDDLKEEAEGSNDFQEVMKSEEVKELEEVLKGVGTNGGERWQPVDIIHECLMTTMCTDRSLPEVLDDYGTEGGIFARMTDFSTWKLFFKYFYNNAAFAKLAMGPLWAELLDKMLLTYNIEDHLEKDREAPRMVLYSGHDNTIMPLLASLDFPFDYLPWTPYASMFIIEVHAILDEKKNPNYTSGRAFRLLYNGDVLTSKIPNCPPHDDLCDLQYLVQLVEPFATRDRDCDSVKNAAPAQSMTVTRTWLLGVVLSASLVTSLFTVLVTVWFVRRRMKITQREGLFLTVDMGEYGSAGNGYEEDTTKEYEFNIS